MINFQHTIKKFSLELQTQSVEQSYALHSRCNKLVKEDLIGGLDKILSTQFNNDEIIRINKIEIDLGNISNSDLEKEFIEKCIAGFTEKIKNINVSKKIDTALPEIEIISNEANSIEQFFYFLSTGKMPWALQGINFANWQTELTVAIKNNQRYFIEKLRETAAQQPAAIERLILQFDDFFILAIVPNDIAFIKTDVESLFLAIKKIIPFSQMVAVRKKVLHVILPALLNLSQTKEENKVQQLIHHLRENYAGMEEKIIISLQEKITAIVKKINGNILAGEINKTTAEKTIIEELQTVEKNEDSKEKIKNITEEKSVFIENAGLIILHPFLQNLFKAAELMEEECFKNDFCKQKAAHLLQYLVNGEQQLPEFIMPLNKILCGLSNEEHIDRFIELEDAEIKEASELLNAVIAHWTVLKNTSAASLQQTFLQRKGKLTFNETDGYWKLQVQRNAVDILLDKIPWGFAYIKLPWMLFPLAVEW
ncbi:contractile injection system tape measure protein [Ferruginibacter sp.]